MKYTPRIQATFRKFGSIFQNKLVRIAVQVVIFFLSVLYLYSQYKDAGDVFTQVDFNFQELAFALLLTIFAVVLGALGWSFTLLTFSQTFKIREGFRIHLLSNLAKYIPGYAWQLVGKAYLTGQQGIAGIVIGVAMATELVQVVGIGFASALIFIPPELSKYWQDIFPQLNLIYLRIFGIILLITLPFVIYVLLKRTPRLPADSQLRFSMFVFSYLSIFIGWLVFGLAFWMIGYSIEPQPLILLPGFIFTLAASIVIGLAIVIIPGSIGVRESIMVFFLTDIGIISSIAVIIAVLSRLIITVSEVISYLIFQSTTSIRRNNKIERFQ